MDKKQFKKYKQLLINGDKKATKSEKGLDTKHIKKKENIILITVQRGKFELEL